MKTPIETQIKPLKEVCLDVLPEDVPSCHEVIRALGAQVEDYRGRLDSVLRRLYGPRSERFNPDLPTLFDLGEAEAGADPVEAEPGPAPQPHPRNGHGRRKLPKDLRRQRVEHDLPAEAKTCAACGCAKERIGEEVSEHLDFEPASVFVVEHVRFKYACKHCEEGVVTAEKPAQPIDKGLPGPGLLAHVIVSKYADHLPLHRQEGILSRHGIDLSRSTLCDWAMAGAELLEPIVEAMKAEVLKSYVIHGDDTPVQAQTSGKPGRTHRSFLWTYVGDEDHPYTLYHFTWTRHSQGPMAFLRDFRGYFQADAFPGYEELYRTGRIVEVGCWAHGRRKFDEALSTSPVYANQGILKIQGLYRVEGLLGGAPLEERLAVRLQSARPILEDLRDWLTRLGDHVLPKSPIGQAAAYTLGNWDALNRYVCDPRLDIDNNAAERALRSIAVGRKNYLFLGSPRGGRAAATLYSLIESAKRHKLDPFAYLRDLLRRVSTHPQKDIAQLLPDRWKLNPP